jgi:raffinose/stachyose/melibiose transport system substrate-binding protein
LAKEELRMKRTITRRDFLAAGGSAALVAVLTSCNFGVGQQRAVGSGGATVWDISTGEQQQLAKQVVDKFNSSHKGEEMTIQFFQNDPYKNKLRTAIGSGNPPDLFYGWGGGILQSYVDAGEVADISSSVDTGRFFPAVMEGVTFDGKIYGVPRTGTQPVLFYYNKQIFDKYNLTPPQDWDELLGMVKTLNGQGVTPISLAGLNKWPGMMYEEYLVNRLGGPGPFKGVLNRESGAWSDPAFIEANTMIQDLVSMKAFPSDFSALNYDTGQSTQLLYSGKAAMQLMGSWDYQAILTNAPDFIESGNLGWFDFPEVEGGKGDPENVAGNLTNFYSLTEASDAKKVATDFLNDKSANELLTDGLIKIGLVPPVKGIEAKLKSSDNSEWLLHVYNMAQNAPYYDLSWDQALPPQPAQSLLTNIDQIFLKQITPKQFSENMNQAMGL